ncbi:type VI secretion system protein TssA [Paraburkholderia lacunae]|uniref:type VI secretion system protein TssA n=1 Tax=Paraburkholderia lacunae TaxID=2211104 RepID=UPI001FCA65DF|nr:type VI secretion system protein TssA [Paraburkholderia lacunae]
MFDADAILTELSVDAPCGSDLEYDAAFLELEELAKGKEEAQFGATVIAGEPPDWKAIRKACLALFTRTRDLRIAIHLTRAMLETEGIAGFTDGLVVLDRLLDAHWDHVHPQLDPDDDNDPTMRVNALSALIEPTTVLRTLKAAPLIDAGVAGRVSLRDIEIANGEMPAPEGEEAPTTTLIEGIFLNVDLGVLQQSAAVLEEACARIEHIESQLTQRVGAARAIDLTELTRLLKRARDFTAQRLQRRAPADAVEAGEAAAANNADGDATQSGAKAPARKDEITGRDDVTRLLDKLCAYYERHEPSSPVPLMLQRARRLVTMNFLEIVADLAPESMASVRQVGGIQSE